MRKIAGYLTKNRSEKDQKIAQSTHENGYIKPRKTFWRNSKQLLSIRRTAIFVRPSMFFQLFQSVFQLPYLRIRKTSTHRGAPLRSFRQTIFRNSFLLLIHLLFQGYILHRPMKYIFIGSCSIYSTADAVYIHFSKVLSCTVCSACRAFGAMRFWPPWMMQASLGLSRPWSFSSFFRAGQFPPVSAIAGNRGCWARPGRCLDWHSKLPPGLPEGCKGHRTG